MYKIALKKAKIEYPIIKKSNTYHYKAMKTSYGYAYSIYFNKTPDASNAHMILVTMDNNCVVKHIMSPSRSTFYLKSNNKCKTLGTVVGDNHDLIVKKCGTKYQFKASNDALSRYFSRNEIIEISKIYNNAKKNHSSFSNKQVIYDVNGLKIWVRLYSASRWFLVFDMDSIAPHPANSKASIWIENNKFKDIAKIIDKSIKKKRISNNKKIRKSSNTVKKNTYKILSNVEKFKFAIWDNYSLNNIDTDNIVSINDYTYLWEDTLKSKEQKLNLSNAKKYCDNLNTNNNKGWGLPSKTQLLNLYKNNQQKYYSTDSFYWSNPHSELISLKDGEVYKYKDNYKFKYNVKCIKYIENYPKYYELATFINKVIDNELALIKQDYPSKPTKETIIKQKVLIKSKFETTADFKERESQYNIDRKKYIHDIETKFNNKISEYNNNIKYFNEVTIKGNINNIRNNIISKLYNGIYGTPKLIPIDYNADKEMFYGKIVSTANNFEQNISIKIPLKIAESFYKTSKSIQLHYIYKNGEINLKDIVILFDKKSYFAKFENTKNNIDIKIANIVSKKINLKRV